MIKVFEDLDYMRVGQLQSIMEAQGIRTFLKNQFGFGGTGELPFVETVPQLFVLMDEDVDRARSLIEAETAYTEPGPPWTCPDCSEENAAAFSHCWKCNTRKDPDA